MAPEDIPSSASGATAKRTTTKRMTTKRMTAERMATEPKSTCTGLYTMFLLFGVGSLLPFNCYITPGDYLGAFYPKPTLSFFSLLYNVGNWTMMFIYLKVGHKIPAKTANLVVFSTWIVCLTILPILVFIGTPTQYNEDGSVNSSSDREEKVVQAKLGRFVAALILVIISGTLNGICFPKIVSVGSRISFDMVQAMMSGNGIAGIITEVLYVITKGISIATVKGDDQRAKDNQLKYGTLAYFILADIVLIACIICWINVMRTYPHLNYDEPPADSKKEVQMESSVSGTSMKLAGESVDTGVKPVDSAINPKTGRRYTFMELVRILLIPGFSVFLVFLITLAFFPAITGKIAYTKIDKNPKVDPDNWWFVGMMSLFMVFDYVGRTIPQIKVLTKLRTVHLLIFALCRLVFCVLFILMVFPQRDDPKKKPYDPNKKPIICSDWAAAIVMILFALTNGYVSTVTMIRYGDHVPDSSYMASSGSIMSFWLNTGLISGGLVSLGIDLGMNPNALSFKPDDKNPGSDTTTPAFFLSLAKRK